MAKVVEQSLRFCPNCQRETIHLQEREKIGWIVHLLLLIITAGLWIFVLALVLLSHVMSIPIFGKKTCANCGLRH